MQFLVENWHKNVISSKNYFEVWVSVRKLTPSRGVRRAFGSCLRIDPRRAVRLPVTTGRPSRSSSRRTVFTLRGVDTSSDERLGRPRLRGPPAGEPELQLPAHLRTCHKSIHKRLPFWAERVAKTFASRNSY